MNSNNQKNQTNQNKNNIRSHIPEHFKTGSLYRMIKDKKNNKSVILPSMVKHYFRDSIESIEDLDNLRYI